MNKSDIWDQMIGRRLWQIFIGIVGSILLVMLFGLSRYRIKFVHKDLDKVAVQQEKTVPVNVLRVTRSSCEDTVVLVARVEPILEAVLASEKAGVIVGLDASIGDKVKAGQVLMRVDARLWSNNLERASAVYLEARNEYGRLDALSKTGAVSDSAFDAVTKNRDLSRMAFNVAKDDFDRCYVKSPFSGVLDDLYFEKGEYVPEGGSVLKMVDISKVKLLMDVPERDVLCVAVGDTVVFQISAYPEKSFSGEVSFVSVAADNGRNSFRVEVVVDNKAHLLRGGMIANAVLKRGLLENVIVLPLVAVLPLKGEYVVFVVENSRVLERIVKIESILGQNALISSGIEDGDIVVVEGQRALSDGMLVGIEEARGDELSE